ncbi:MAG: glycosyltransferase family 39 protein [Acidimicrobiales bacterium]
MLPSSRRAWRLVVLVLGAALLVRVGTVVAIRDTYVPLNDAVAFDSIASSIVDGEGFGDSLVPAAEGPAALRGPAYPVVLAALYAVVGTHHMTWGLLQQAVIGTVLVALIGVVAAQLFSRRAALAAMGIAAVHPTLLLFGSSLQLELMLAGLELAAIAAALQHRRRPQGLRWPIVAGICIGLTMLTREIGLLLIPTVVLLLWPRREGASPVPHWSRAALAAPVACLAVTAAVMVPWTVRNAVQFDAFIPLTTSAGVALAGTYNETSFDEKADPALWRPPWLDRAMADVMIDHEGDDEAAMDRALRQEAIDFVIDHPGYVPKAMLWNTVRLFDLEGTDHALFVRQFIPYPEMLTRLAVYASYLVWLVALAGLFLPALRRRLPWPVALFPVLVWLGLAVLSGNIRYRASLEPLAVVVAGGVVALVADRLPRPRMFGGSTPETGG